MRKRFKISDGEVVVLFVGSGFERKGLEYLVKAVQYLERKNWRLVLVGKGNWERYLSFASKENQRKIIYLDPIDAIE